MRVSPHPAPPRSSSVDSPARNGLHFITFLRQNLKIAVLRYHRVHQVQIGKVIIWLGLPQLLVIPLVPRLMQRFDARILIGIGILLFGGSSFLTSHLDSNFAGPQFYIPLAIRALGQPLIMVPLSAVSTAGMAKGR
ncbi:hypothetical protein [Tunturiibacter gelidiferens]|uniref:MFS transporter n=1 Tax=Tunturiibacter gelidiferens TaxID=3069689 RepID=A0AAU7Z5Z8_9BACT